MIFRQSSYQNLKLDKKSEWVPSITQSFQTDHTSDGNAVRRNRQFLKPTEAQEKQHADVNAPAMECNHNEIPREAVIPEQTPSP